MRKTANNYRSFPDDYTATAGPSLMGVTVSINGADQRTDQGWQKSPAIIKSLP